MKFPAFRTALALALVALPATGTLPVNAPAFAPAPAYAQKNGLSASDKKIGGDSHAEIVSQFGGRIDGALADYVRTVGLKVALQAVPESQPQDWTITVLNSPVPNAMATPGGYLYITRGLLGMINSEAELASVLGHEAGHVAARHANKRSSRATVAGLGTLAAAILGGGDIANIVNVGGQAWVSGYSRSQENDADSRGLSYSVAAGYDPRAAAEMLAALERVSAVEGKAATERSGLQSIFSTHPVTTQRITRVSQQANRMPAGGAINKQAFLNAIDGMTYGDSPDQGLVSGSSFRHGTLRIAFDAPAGFALQNNPDAVLGQGRDGSNFTFSGFGQTSGSLQQVVNQLWAQIGNGQVPNYQSNSTSIHGLTALVTTARANTTRGSAADVGIAVYRLPNGQTYGFRTVAPAGQGKVFDPLYLSFRQLTTAEAKDAMQGLQIKVVTVGANDSAASLSRRMAAPYNREQSFLALNGLTQSRLTPGQQVKLIVQ